MATTGINATAVAGSTYTATVQYGNVSWGSCNVNHSANVTLNILANGVVVSSSTFAGLAQGAAWNTATVGWVCPAAKAGQAIQIADAWRRTSWKDHYLLNSGKCLRLPSPKLP